MITVSWELEVVTAITLSFIKQMGYWRPEMEGQRFPYLEFLLWLNFKHENGQLEN